MALRVRAAQTETQKKGFGLDGPSVSIADSPVCLIKRSTPASRKSRQADAKQEFPSRAPVVGEMLAQEALGGLRVSAMRSYAPCVCIQGSVQRKVRIIAARE